MNRAEKLEKKINVLEEKLSAFITGERLVDYITLICNAEEYPEAFDRDGRYTSARTVCDVEIMLDLIAGKFVEELEDNYLNFDETCCKDYDDPLSIEKLTCEDGEFSKSMQEMNRWLEDVRLRPHHRSNLESWRNKFIQRLERRRYEEELSKFCTGVNMLSDYVCLMENKEQYPNAFDCRGVYGKPKAYYSTDELTNIIFGRFVAMLKRELSRIITLSSDKAGEANITNELKSKCESSIQEIETWLEKEELRSEHVEVLMDLKVAFVSAFQRRKLIDVLSLPIRADRKECLEDLRKAGVDIQHIPQYLIMVELETVVDRIEGFNSTFIKHKETMEHAASEQIKIINEIKQCISLQVELLSKLSENQMKSKPRAQKVVGDPS